MVLIVDIGFPTKYGKWRLEEIKSFMLEGATDVLVYKIESFAGNQFGVDYEDLKDYYDLGKYNILIFDKRYNYLNKYNTRVDGTLFNGKFPGSYLFTKEIDFDVFRYDIVYHIFLMCWSLFNKGFSYSNINQFIHLYPGGGYLSPDSLSVLSDDVNIITTQRFITDALKTRGNNIIELLGAPFLQKDNDTFVPRKINENGLGVGFTSLGTDLNKGASLYASLVKKYKEKFPEDKIEFYSVGNCPLSKDITHFPPMDIRDLEKVFDDWDVIVSPINGEPTDGWPAGIEAMLRGCVSMTPDPRNMNQYYKYTDEMMVIVENKNILQMVDKIKELYSDRQRLNAMSNKAQAYTYDLFSYANQQEKIFEFIDNRFSRGE